MSITPTTPTAPASPPARTDTRSGIMADALALFGPDVVPSADDAAPPAAEPAQVQDSGHADADAPTRDEAEQVPKPEKAPPAPPKEAAPEPVTLTQAEYALLKRQATDQSKTASRLAQLEADNKRLTLEAQARESALASLIEQYQGTEVETAALREYTRGNNFVRQSLDDETKTAEDAVNAARTLSADKGAAANAIYHQHYGPLQHEAGQLGVTIPELNSIIDGVLHSPEMASFQESFKAAQSVDEARRIVSPGYVLMAERVRAALQQKKIDTLKEPERDNPRPDRTQAHGTGGNVAVDPLGQLPMGQRALRRTSDGLMEDARRLYQLEQ